MELQDAYPSPSLSTVLAWVDVNLLLENMKREDLEIGAWVNVIGYLGGVSEEGGNWKAGRSQAQQAGDKRSGVRARVVKVEVQAVMLWSAGAIKIADYERALGERLKSTRCTLDSICTEKE